MSDNLDCLLISTWTRVFIRRPDGTLWTLADKGAPFYGLTWDDGYLYVGARCWGNDDHDHLLVMDKDTFETVVDWRLPTAGALHQIVYHDGAIYLTDTKLDRVLRWWNDEWDVAFDLGTGEDRFHINSLWSNGSDIWAAGLHGDIWCNWLWQCRYDFEVHNIYFEPPGRIVLGASDRQAVYRQGQFVSLSDPIGVLHDRDDLWQAYTRGLARSERYYYVGAAAVQDRRNERWQGNSAIVVYSHDWQPVNVLRFDNTGGMHDIRVLDMGRPDWAHNPILW